MILIVTGTPGTGKTTFSKNLASDKGFEYLDVTKFIIENGISDGFDKKKDCEIIDIEKLNSGLIKLIKIKKDLIIDSHLSHYLPNEFIDKCYVTKCNLKELEKRLLKRGYSKEKVRENLDSEIFDICKIEAEENGHNVEVVYTD